MAAQAINAHIDVRTICMELGEVTHKWFKIGIQLGISRGKLKEFEKEADPLSAVIDYWLDGNVEGIPVSWRSVVSALESSHVDETGLANRISRKYCFENEGFSNPPPPPESVASQAVSTTTTSSGSNSSMQLPPVDLGPHFPYLSPGKMDEDELTYHRNELVDQTEKIKQVFNGLLLHLKQDIETTAKLEDVVLLLLFNFKDKGFEELMHTCKSITEVFSQLSNFVSFFNFDLVKVLAHHFGSLAIKKKLKRYKIRFQKYSKRRVCECPKDAFGEAEKSDKIYRIKTDKILETFTVEDLDKLQHEIRKILGHKLLRLLKVEDGCIELTFRVINCDDFDISEDQKQSLSDLGVLSVACQQKVLYITTKTYENTSGTNSDSGILSKITGTGTQINTEKSSDSGIFSRRCDADDKQMQRSRPFKDLIDPRIQMITSAKLEPTDRVGGSPLYTAVYQDDLQRVKQLIELGKNPLNKDTNGDTLLHFATALGKLNILKYLVEDVGCNPATEGFEGRTTLHTAASANQLHIVQYLIEQCQLDPTTLDSVNYTPLFHACLSGSLDVVRYLIKCMLNYYRSMEDIMYNSYDEVGFYSINSPLRSACFKGHLSIVKYLVEECGCDPSRSEGSSKLRTPLDAAVSGNHLHVVEYLKKLVKVDSHTKEYILTLAISVESLQMVKLLTQSLYCDPNGKHDDISPIYRAATLGNLGIMKYLLYSLKCDPGIKSDQGRLPIHGAAIKGHLDVVKCLIEGKFCYPSVLDEEKVTPLYYAARSGHLPVVRYLTLEHHCDPMHTCLNSNTSLHAAAISGYTDEVIRFFVKELKCDPNSKGELGAPVIHCAASSGNLKLVKVLVDEFRCDPLMRDNLHRTALHLAVRHGKLQVLRYFLEEKQCDSNCTDRDNDTILFKSVVFGQLHILQYLIEEIKMDKNSYNSKFKNSLLNEAAIYGHLKIVSYLLEIGSDYRDKNSLTPLHYASSKGHLDLVNYLMTSYPNMYSLNPISPLVLATVNGHLGVIKLFLGDGKLPMIAYTNSVRTLLESGTDYFIVKSIFEKGFVKATLQHIACTCGHLKVLKFFSDELNCDPNSSVTSETADKPIHFAALFGKLNIVKYLVEELKCDVNSMNAFGDTPLHIAAAKGYLDVVCYLIEKKAEIVCYNSERNTPLHFAANTNRLEVIKLLTAKVRNYPFVVNCFQQTPLHVALLSRSGISTLYLIVTMFKL